MREERRKKEKKKVRHNGRGGGNEKLNKKVKGRNELQQIEEGKNMKGGKR